MAELTSKKFGKIDYREDSVFLFPLGLPAFEQEKEFAPVEDSATAGLVYLQSTKTPELCFLAFPAAAIDPNYQLEVSRDDLSVLGLDTHRQPKMGPEVLVLVLLCISDENPLTANLSAPVVVNLANRVAVQAVRSDGRYSSRHQLPQEGAC